MTKCTICGKDLTEATEIHAMHGMLFCSKTCAIAYLQDSVAYVCAVQMYRNDAEIVTPEEIGLKEDYND